MTKILGVTLVLIGVAQFAIAGGATPAPEISPGSAAAALALLSGAILVIRGRRRK